MHPAVEQRQHPRHSVRFDSLFSSDGTQIEDGLVVDRSRGGCRITSARLFPAGTSIELQIRPEHHAYVYIPWAVVRWVGDGAFGVDFTQLPSLEADTLTRLLWSVAA